MSPGTIRKRSPIASMTALSGHAGCSTTILVLAEPAPKSSRKRGRSSSSVGLLSTALPKTARRLCASLTAHATCRQLNGHPNEFRVASRAKVPALVGFAGPAAETRFLEFFAANMRSAQDAPRLCQRRGCFWLVRPAPRQTVSVRACDSAHGRRVWRFRFHNAFISDSPKTRRAAAALSSPCPPNEFEIRRPHRNR